MQRLAFGSLHRPSRVAERQVDLRGVRRFVLTPSADVPRERDLATLSRERFAEYRLQLATKRGAVERRGVFELVFVECLALHDLALAGEHGRELVLRFLQGGHFGRNAEQLRDEILDVRRERDKKVGLALAPQRMGLCAPGSEPRRKRSVCRLEMRNERRVQAREPRARVEVVERQSESKVQHKSCSRHAPTKHAKVTRSP